MDRESNESTTGIDGHLFRLIATFEAAAMQQLGKIVHPVTGDVEVNLEGASDSIDMLEMVRRKTEGNLNEDERRLLEHVLYQLRMNYVDVTREKQSGEPPEGEAPSSESADKEPGEPEATGDDVRVDEPKRDENAGDSEEGADAGRAGSGGGTEEG